MSIGCRGQNIDLSCIGEDSRITIRKATYGSYYLDCSESCCPPNPKWDCTEDMQTVHSDIFEYLQQQCDGEQSCSYEFNGYVMDTSCNSDDADYLQVFYDCSHITQGPVAFMVQNVERNSMLEEEVVPWRDVYTNFGLHYHPDTYSFVCPYRGVYIFSVSFSVFNDFFGVYLFRNDNILSFAVADDGNNDFDSTSSFAVAECLPGDVVWVRVGFNGTLWNSLHHNWFSGFLLTKLELFTAP